MPLSRLSSPFVRIALAGLAVVSVAFSPSTAAAQEAPGWYAGLQAGWQQLRFQPDYTFLQGGAPRRFDNRQSGLQWGALFGRRAVLNERWAVRLEAGAAVNRTTWSLELPAEPAAFEYTMPYSVRIAVLPERRVGTRASVFGSIGVGAGRVHERKTSPTSSRYDVSRTRPMFVAGGGVTFAVSSRTRLRAEYLFRQLGGFEFDTVDPAGRLIEHVEDRPFTHSVSAGIVVGL